MHETQMLPTASSQAKCHHCQAEMTGQLDKGMAGEWKIVAGVD